MTVDVPEEEAPEPNLVSLFFEFLSHQNDAMETSGKITISTSRMAAECFRLAAEYRVLAEKMESAGKFIAMVGSQATTVAGDVILNNMDISADELMGFQGIELGDEE